MIQSGFRQITSGFRRTFGEETSERQEVNEITPVSSNQLAPNQFASNQFASNITQT